MGGRTTAVWVPDGVQEGLRDLTQAREDEASAAASQAAELAFLLGTATAIAGRATGHRHTMVAGGDEIRTASTTDRIPGRCRYGQGNEPWGKCDGQADRKRGRESVFWPVIEGLMALRGVNLLTATMIVAEIGDLRRFASAPQLMAYLGVVPSEHSSGGNKSRGRNYQDRQWSCAPGSGGGGMDVSPSSTQDHGIERRAKRPRKSSKRFLEGTKADVRALSIVGSPWKAKGESRRRSRELTGFIWAMGQALPPPVANARSQQDGCAAECVNDFETPRCGN